MSKELSQGIPMPALAAPSPGQYWLRAGLVTATVTVSFFSAVAVLYIAQLLGLSPESLHGSALEITPQTVALFLGFFVAQIGLVCAVHRFVHRQPLGRLGFGSRFFPHFAPAFALGLVVSGLEQGADALLASGSAIRWAVPAEVSVASVLGYYAFWFVLILTLNSVSEELTFRVYPIEHLVDRKHGALPVVAATAVAFSLIHHLAEPFTWRAFVSRVLAALLLGFLYQRFRSAWLVCGVHNGMNFAALTFSGNWRIGGLWELTLQHGSESLRILARVVIVAMTLLLLQRFLPGTAGGKRIGATGLSDVD